MPNRDPTPGDIKQLCAILESRKATPGVQQTAVTRLRRNPDPRAIPALTDLTDRLLGSGAPLAGTRFELACAVLGEIGTDDAYAHLQALWTRDAGTADNRAAILRGLGQFARPERARLLATGLTDEELVVRKAAAQTLAGVSLSAAHTARIVPTLYDILDDETARWGLRVKAIAALEAHEGHDAVTTFRALVRDEDTDRPLRARAIEALGKLGGDADVELLLDVLTQALGGERTHTRVAVAAAEALGRRGTATARQRLFDLVDGGTEDENVRAAAIRGLEFAEADLPIPRLEEIGINPTSASDSYTAGRIYHGSEAAKQAAEALADARFDRDPHEAISHIDAYQDERYERQLIEHIVPAVCDAESLELAWAFLDRQVTRANRARLVIAVLNTVDASRDDLVALARWVLETPDPHTSWLTRELRTLLDPRNDRLCHRLWSESPDRTRRAILELIDAYGADDQLGGVCLDLLARGGPDDRIDEALLAIIGEDRHALASEALVALSESGSDRFDSVTRQVLTASVVRPGAQQTAVDLLLKQGDETAPIAYLRDALAETADPARVGFLASRLARLDPSEETYEVLFNALRSERVYDAVYHAYGGIEAACPPAREGDPRRLGHYLHAVDPTRACADLAALVRDREVRPELRCDALRLLRTFGGDEPALFDALVDDPAVSVRYTAGKMLARHQDETAIPLLASVLRESTAPVSMRRYAARYLGGFDTDAARDALAAAIAYEPPSVVEQRDYGSIRATARNELTSESASSPG